MLLLKVPPFISPWVVHSPVFLPLQLNHKRLDVVIMRSEALCSGRCQVSGLKGEHTFHCNWKKNKKKQNRISSITADVNTHTLAPAMLPNCSWRMDSTFHTVEEKAWGLSMRREQPAWKIETWWWLLICEWCRWCTDTLNALNTKWLLACGTENIQTNLLPNA